MNNFDYDFDDNFVVDNRSHGIYFPTNPYNIYPSSFEYQNYPEYYNQILDRTNDDDQLFDEVLLTTLQDLDDSDTEKEIIELDDDVNESHTTTSKDNSLDNSNDNSKQPRKTKKRKPAIRSAEAIAKRNLRRRAHAFPRILRRDIRREYMNHYVNVMNSADLSLMIKYLNRYFHPNVVIAKSDFTDSNTSSYPTTTIQVRGRDVFSNLFISRLNDMPDYTMNIKDTKLRVDPKTNRCLISCDFVIKATKVKSTLSGYEAMVKRMNDIIEGIDLLADFRASSSEDQNKQNKEKDHLYNYANLINSDELNHKQILEFQPNDFFKHRMFVTNNKNVLLKDQLQQFITYYHPMYQKNIEEFKATQLESNAISFSTNPLIPHDPIICLNPPIKSCFEGTLFMFLDENFIISHIETKMAVMAFEPLIT